MQTTSTWSDFLSSIGPYLTTKNPLEALKQAGYVLGGEVAQAFNRDPVPPAFGPNGLEALEAVYGTPPRVNLRVTKPQASAPAPPAQPQGLGGFGAVVSADLAVLNQIIAELWRVNTIPKEYSPDITSTVLTLADLKDACTGVPAGAALGNLQLTAPPVASASNITPLNLHFDIPFNLPVDPSGPASLRGVVHVEQPLAFEINTGLNPDKPQIQLSPGAITELQAKLEVDSISLLQLRSEDKRALLEQKFALALQRVWFFLFSGKLVIPAQVGVSNTFPNSKVTISQAGAVCVRSGSKVFAIGGINVGPTGPTNPSALLTARLPQGGNNIHALLDEAFSSDALSSIIASGDLAAYFNRIVARHVPFGQAPTIVVTGGRVGLENGLIRVTVDCVAQNACAFGKDLGFTTSVYGIPNIDGDTVTIKSSDVDMDLDDFDAVVCTVLSAFLGPFGIIITEVALAIIAAYNPTGRDLEFPTADTSQPLPGSELDFKIQLTSAAVSPGSLTADGVASLVPDVTRAFVYLRLVTGNLPEMKTPLAGATVELLELDLPAPAGDDVVIPETGETETFTEKLDIDIVKSYQPLPDQSLGSGITDKVGYVRIVSPMRTAAGIFTTTTTTEDVLTGKVLSTNTQHRLIQETKPDFAINVTAADGTVMAQRMPIALNNPGKHLGTLDGPFEVHVAAPVG